MPLNATLHIDTALKNGKTILQTSYCTQPFKLANITENRVQKELQLMLMSSSPGILDGDQHAMTITVGEGCCLSVETQSYQRIFQMQKGASQQVHVNMQRGSSFTYLPHPLVPHRGAIFRVKNKVMLQEGCSLLWGEVISCGRKLNGEVFAFTSYHGITEIYRDGKLVVKENLLLRPREMPVSGLGQLEGFTHQATLLYLDEKAVIPALTEAVREALNADSGLTFGVSALPVNGLVIRLLGNQAEKLFAQLKTIALLLQTHKSESSKILEQNVV
jgi:urease accessory protein